MQEQIRHQRQQRQMHRIEPVECPFGPLRAAAALTVVEPEQHERQRGGDLPQHQHGPKDALFLPGVPRQVQSHDEGHPNGPIVCPRQLGHHCAGQRCETACPDRIAVGILGFCSSAMASTPSASVQYTF